MFSHSILIKIFNNLVDNNENLQFFYYRYCIINWSLISKEWKEKIIPKFEYGRIQIVSLAQLDQLLQWKDQGIIFKYVSVNRDLAIQLQKLISNDPFKIKSFLECFYRDNENPQPISDIPLELYGPRFIDFGKIKTNYFEFSFDTHSDIVSFVEKVSIYAPILKKGIPFLYATTFQSSDGSQRDGVLTVLDKYKVQSLSINVTDFNISYIQSIHLKELTFFYFNDFSYEDLNNFLLQCPLLETLTIKSSRYTGDTIFPDSIHSHLCLKHYFINNTNPEPFESFLKFINKTTLEKLGFPMLQTPTTSTKCIRNNTIKQFTNTDFISEILHLWEIPSALTVLTANTFQGIDPIDTAKFHPNLTKVESKNISRNSRFISLPNISYNQNLTELSVVYKVHLDSIPLVESIKESFNLQILKLQGFSQHYNKILELNNKKLKKIEFTPCDESIFNGLMKNNSIEEAILGVEFYVKDLDTFAQDLKIFLNCKHSLKQLSITTTFKYKVMQRQSNGPEETKKRLDKMFTTLKSYYTKHRSPMNPNTLNIDSIDNYQFLKY